MTKPRGGNVVCVLVTTFLSVYLHTKPNPLVWLLRDSSFFLSDRCFAWFFSQMPSPGPIWPSFPLAVDEIMPIKWSEPTTGRAGSKKVTHFSCGFCSHPFPSVFPLPSLPGSSLQSKLHLLSLFAGNSVRCLDPHCTIKQQTTMLNTRAAYSSHSKQTRVTNDVQRNVL